MQQTANFHSANDLDIAPEAEEISLEQLDEVNGGVAPALFFLAGLAIGWLARGN
jgi:hypothetical protein